MAPYTLRLNRKSRAVVLPDVRLSGPVGSAEVSMVLDTGAFYSVISKSNAIRLGFNLSKHKVIPIITGNGVIQAPLILLKSMSVGKVKVRNLPAICVDIPEMGSARGYVGLTFLQHISTTIDYRRLVLRIQ